MQCPVFTCMNIVNVSKEVKRVLLRLCRSISFTCHPVLQALIMLPCMQSMNLRFVRVYCNESSPKGQV